MDEHNELNLPDQPEREDWFDPFYGDVPERPRLRREPLPEVHVFRLRMELNRSEPTIWREVEVRSDLGLSDLHQVVQAAFLWWDAHLHRFSLGAEGFDDAAELFLCPFDVQEQDPMDVGTPEEDVRLDETVQQAGDVLHYLYDYGDHWDLTVTLVSIGQGTPDAPVAVYRAGERAAPPEDCGSRRTADGLAEVLDDLEDVGAEQVRSRLDGLEWAAKAASNPDRVSSLFDGYPLFRTLYERLDGSLFAMYLGAKMEALRHPRSTLTTADKAETLSGITALLGLVNGAGEKGVKLTGSGYLPPSIVTQAVEGLPAGNDQITRGRSESKMRQVLGVRTALTTAGLLRKSRGRLMLTAKGRTSLDDPEALWAQLASRFPVQAASGEDTTFDDEVTPLILLCVATGRFPEAEKEAIAELLTAAGWEQRVGHVITGVSPRSVRSESPMMWLLTYTAPLEERDWLPRVYSDAASALAHDALTASAR